MEKKKWTAYGLFIALSQGVGILSGFLSRAGTEYFGAAVIKPPLSPPGILFPVVWTVLYTLMGIGAAAVYLAPPSAQRSRGLNLFVTQLVVNFFWSLIFFNAQAYGLAFFWLLLLWALVVLMTLSFYRVEKWAALLQIPYILWLTFAAYLAAGVWYLN